MRFFVQSFRVFERFGRNSKKQSLKRIGFAHVGTFFGFFSVPGTPQEGWREGERWSVCVSDRATYVRTYVNPVCPVLD